jgi:hypothetical protein
MVGRWGLLLTRIVMPFSFWNYEISKGINVGLKYPNVLFFFDYIAKISILPSQVSVWAIGLKRKNKNTVFNSDKFRQFYRKKKTVRNILRFGL